MLLCCSLNTQVSEHGVLGQPLRTPFADICWRQSLQTVVGALPTVLRSAKCNTRYAHVPPTALLHLTTTSK